MRGGLLGRRDVTNEIRKYKDMWATVSMTFSRAQGTSWDPALWIYRFALFSLIRSFRNTRPMTVLKGSYWIPAHMPKAKNVDF